MKGEYNLATTKRIYFSHHVITCEFHYNKHVKRRFPHNQKVQLNPPCNKKKYNYKGINEKKKKRRTKTEKITVGNFLLVSLLIV